MKSSYLRTSRLKIILPLLLYALTLSLQQSSFNVNMDIDISQGDYMVNTQCVYSFSVFTSSVQAGTKIVVKVPYQLQVIATSGSTIGQCREAAYTASTNTWQNRTLTNCVYNEYIGYSQIEFTTGQSYSGITLYYFYLGMIRNPSSVIYPDSFEIAFSNGYPTGSQTNGLTLTYMPNKIYAATLSYSKVQAGTSDTYVFNFKVTNNVPRFGFIRLSFPSPWTSAPQNILSISAINIYGTSKSGFNVETPISADVTYTGLFDMAQLTADATKSITVTLTGITNPNQMITTGSFEITTLDDAKNPIDQVSTGLTVTISEPGVLTVNSFTVGNNTADEFTYIQFDITPSVKYSTGGYIEIQSPTGYIELSSVVVCNAIYGMVGSQTCTRVDSQTIRFTKALSSTPNVVFSIFQFRNPLGTIQNPPFKIYFKESNGNVVAQTLTAAQYTPVAGYCFVNSAARDPSVLTVGLSGAIYTMTFFCQHRIPSAGRIQVTLPAEQLQYSASTTCQDGTGRVLTCTLSQGVNSNGMTTTIVTINANGWCTSSTADCAALSSLTLKLINARNPNYINTPLTNSIEIVTQNTFNSQWYTIDQIRTGVFFTNSLIPGSITNLALTRTGSALTGGKPIYTFTFTSVTVIPQNAIVRFTFPQNTGFFDSSSVTCKLGATNNACTTTALSTDASQLATVTIVNACATAAGCTAVSFSIEVTNFLNPFSTAPVTTTQFMVQTYVSSTNGLIDQGTFTAPQLALSPNVVTATLSQPSTPIIVGGITSYQIVIGNVNNKIPSSSDNGSLVITLPTDVVLQSASCTAQTGSTALTCVANTSTQKLTITSSSVIAKGSSITVSMPNNVKNPPTGATSQPFLINSYFGTYQIDSLSTLTVKADTFNEILNPTSKRDVFTVNSPIKLTISFQTTNPIPKDARISFKVPTDQAVVGSSSFTATDKSGSGAVSILTTLAAPVSGSSYATFTLKEWCSDDNGGTSCPTTFTSKVEITGFNNPANARFPSNSIIIEIYTSAGDKIDAVSANLYTIPQCNYGALQSVQITRSSNVVGAATSLTFTFQTAAGTAGDLASGQGSLTIFLPTGLLFDKGATQSCTVKDASSAAAATTTTCTATKLTDTMGTYLSKITADLRCGTLYTCSGGMTFQFTLNGYYNPFSTKPKDSLIISTSTITGTGATYEIKNVLDQIIGTDIILPAYVPGALLANSVVRTVTSVDSPTNIQFDITLPNRLEKNGYIEIDIPSQQFVPNGNSFTYQIFSSGSYQSSQSLTVISQTATNTKVQIKEWCSGTGNYCADNTNLKFQINSGFSNVGYVLSTPSTLIAITSVTKDTLYEVDTITTVSATPVVTAAIISVDSIALSDTTAAAVNVNADITVKFGAKVASANYILFTFSNEFIRQDNGAITCAQLVGSTEIVKTCTVTQSSNVVTSIKVDGFCSSTCDASTSYTIRLKNCVNKLFVEAFAGTMLVETRVDANSLIGTKTHTMSSVTTLVPGVLKNTGVTRTATTQGVASEYIITWTIPGLLLDSSIVELSLPQNQIDIGNGKTFFTFTNNGSTSLIFAEGTASATYRYATSNEWLCNNANCPVDTIFTVRVKDSKNPYISTTNYDPFIITHKTTDNKLIFRSAAPLNALPDLTFGVIDGITITHQNSQYVVRNTQYVFTFTVQADIPQGGKLRVTFPPNRVLQQSTTMTCTKSDGSTFPCSGTFTNAATTGATVLMTNVCPSSICFAPLTYTITVAGGMKNPSTVPTITGNFIIESLTSNNFIVSQGKVDNALVTPILPEPLIDPSVNRSSIYMSASSDYRVQFTTLNAIPSAGFFRIVMPTDQVTSPTNGPSCKIDFIMTSLSCRVVFRTAAYVMIDIAQSCSGGCAAGTTVNLVLGDLTNPSTFLANTATSSWMIFTMNAAKEYIDGVSSGLKAQPDLIGKTAIIQALTLDDNIAYRNTFLKIGVITGADLDSSALIDLYFPDLLANSRGINTCYVNLGNQVNVPCTFSYYASGFISKVSMSRPCPNGCNQAATYYFDIPVQNRMDNYEMGGSFKVIVRYEYIDVGLGTLANPLTIVPDTITKYYITNRGCDTIEQSCTVYLSFVPNIPIPNASGRGRIRVVLPSQVKVWSSNCYLSSNEQYSGSCSVSNGVALATHNLGNIVGSNITIEFKQMMNPESTRPTDPWLIYTEWDVLNNKVYYQSDQNLKDVKYSVNGLTELYSCQVQRMPLIDRQGYKTGYQTQLWYVLQLRHALESTSSIIVQFPEDAQVKLTEESSTASCYSTDQAGRLQNLLLCEVNKQNRTIIVRNYCQVANCGKKVYVRFKMLEDFVQNYKYVKTNMNPVNDSLVIKTTTKEGYYYLDTCNKNVFITPDLEPAPMILPSPEIARTNNVINKKVQWVFSFKTSKNSVAQGGYIVINIPKDVLLTIKNSSIDVLNYDTNSLYPNFTQQLWDDGRSVKTITIYNFCNQTQGCQVGAAYSLMLDWVRNPISQLNVKDPITIDLRTKEGYIAEQGITPAVTKLFSELIPVKITNLFMRPVSPIQSVTTDYEFTFSADAEFSESDVLLITFPIEINANNNFTSTSRLLQSSGRCQNMLNLTAKIDCKMVSNQTIRITGLFTNPHQQYAVRVKNVKNPEKSGPTSGAIVEVQNYNALTIASRSTQTRITILDILDQSKCNKVCGSCAGTDATCTSCKVPSKYPLFRQYSCVDNCGPGYFFDKDNNQCHECHHGCETCFGAGSNKCYNCSRGYFMEDGQCVPYCAKAAIEDSTLRQCVNKNQTKCSSNCLTCSLNTTQCLSCNKSSAFPVFDPATSRCIPNDAKLCNNSNSERFFIDVDTLECKVCNELCKTCQFKANQCNSCWARDFQINNLVNELYETCVDVCGLGTWYKKDSNKCAYCNPVCLLCTGYESDQCLVCNKTPEARQLFKLDNQCVLSCPKRFYTNEQTNECQQGDAQLLSFSFIFVIFIVIVSLVAIAVSMWLTRNKNRLIDIIYAITSGVECLNRFFLLGNLWVKTNVFSLAVCFMNLIATCAIAVFFNFLFMTPIYAHSPHFRTLYRKFRCSYQIVTGLSYFAGVNVIRILCTRFLGLQSLNSDLHHWKFFVVPLNTMANFTVIFTLFQLVLDIWCLATVSLEDDVFILAIFGLILNVMLVAFQLYKHLQTRAFLLNKENQAQSQSGQPSGSNMDQLDQNNGVRVGGSENGGQGPNDQLMNHGQDEPTVHHDQ